MSYNSKKAAQAAARKTLGANYAELCTIAPIGDKWDFTKNEVPPVAETVVENLPTIVVPETAPALEGEFIAASDAEETEIPAAPSMLAGLLGNMTGDVPVVQPVPAPKAEPKVSGLTVEKDRPMQNGVKRPSAGGLCRAVWDACWAYQEKTGAAPTAKDVKEIALAAGWNVNNASIEYYQWRKYNGISGRVTKAPAPKAEPQKTEASVTPAFSVAMSMSPVAFS